ERLVARSGLLPQVNANAAEADHRLNVEAMLGISFPGLPQHVGPFQTFQVGGDFEAPVFDLTLWQRYRSARLGVDASRAQELTAREESVLLVVSQYLGSQRAAACAPTCSFRTKSSGSSWRGRNSTPRCSGSRAC